MHAVTAVARTVGLAAVAARTSGVTGRVAAHVGAAAVSAGAVATPAAASAAPTARRWLHASSRPSQQSSAKSGHVGVVRVDNPYSGETVCEVPLVDAAGAEKLVQQAAKAQQQWRTSKINERVGLVNK
jgi:acyl-CoA reductase-like NAD-dependent aldehyde dehydrogenase